MAERGERRQRPFGAISHWLSSRKPSPAFSGRGTLYSGKEEVSRDQRFPREIRPELHFLWSGDVADDDDDAFGDKKKLF